MRKNKYLAIVVASLFLSTLWGCGSNLDSGGDQTGPDSTLADAQPLGINNCLTCHQGGVVAVNVAETWAAGVHGNDDSSPNGLTDPACLACHDQLGDGATLSPARPVVSCESCHGGGQYHNGIAAGIPFAVPDSNRCGQCHNNTFPHGFSPEGKGIVEAFQISPHSRSLNASVFVTGTTNVRARCSKCHSDEGAKQYLNVDGDYAYLSANLPNTLAPLSDASNIECRTCHSPHQEEKLLEALTAGRSAQFNTCTNCHQLVKNDLTKISAYHDPAVNTYGALGEIITDTHFAVPGVFPGGAARGANQVDIAGYSMDFADGRVCLNCHNPHDADTTINNQWADSDHADKAAAGAWAHYNWTETGIAGELRLDGTATSDRTTCQRCHTMRGFIKMATETLGDTPAFVPFNDYQPSYKPEMLHCNGCHTDSVGNLRPVAAVKVQYTNVTTATVYPDASSSNICIACHTGLESGESIKASPADFTNAAFINSHYLTGGGTLYTTTGYEYTTQDYTNVPFYAHDKIGTAAATGTGDKGPCVGCHLTAVESHSFQPVERDETTGLIVAITSQVCATCHAGEHGPAFVAKGGIAAAVQAAASFLNTEEEDFKAALESLSAQLTAAGHPFLGGYPYFATGDWTNSGTYVGKDLMGAAFNYNLLEHDPGAYAHNRIYTKRLIYDSIDYVDDTQFNGSVAAAIDALVLSGDLSSAEGEQAKTYLDGVSGTTGIQRP